MHIAILKTAIVTFIIAATSYAMADNTTKVIGRYGKYPIYDLRDQDLDDSAFGYTVNNNTQVTTEDLALMLNPVDVADIGKNGIYCTFLCENPQHQIIGYDPRRLEKALKRAANAPKPMTAEQRDAYRYKLDREVLQSNKSAVMPSSVPPIKVVGRWKQYDVYAVDQENRGGGRSPLTDVEVDAIIKLGATYYRDSRQYIQYLKPIDKADIEADLKSDAIYCTFICRNVQLQIIGYDVRIYRAYIRKLSQYSPEKLAMMEQRTDERIAIQIQRDREEEESNARRTKEEAEQAAERANRNTQILAARQNAERNRPKIVNPHTSSDIPIDVIRNVISSQESAWDLTTWNELNTFTLKKENETVRYIEYKASWYLKPNAIEYLGSTGGISFRSASASSTGRIGLVKRGNSWYIVSNTKG